MAPPEGGAILWCRGSGIRTHDLLVPNEARYQAAPHPDVAGCDALLPVQPDHVSKRMGSSVTGSAGSTWSQAVSVSTTASGRQSNRTGA